MRIKDARQTFLGVWIRRLLENQPIEVWGGTQLRDFTDVDDAVEAFLLAAVSPKTDGEVYNLGGNQVINLADLAKLLIEVNGAGIPSCASFPRTVARSTSAITTAISARFDATRLDAAADVARNSCAHTRLITANISRNICRMILHSNPRAGYLAQKKEIDEAIARVLASGSYILGPEVEKFEK